VCGVDATVDWCAPQYRTSVLPMTLRGETLWQGRCTKRRGRHPPRPGLRAHEKLRVAVAGAAPPLD
jgi:hypothetical protein